MEFGAVSVFKNGPQSWSMDEVRVMGSESVSVAGVDMIFGAHLPPGTLASPKYTVFNPAKTQYLVWEAGEPAYQLIDPDGNVYVVQGYKVPQEALETLMGIDTQEIERTGSDRPVGVDLGFNVAFIAMSQKQLGRDDVARKELARLRELMQDPHNASDRNLQAFFSEAEALIDR